MKETPLQFGPGERLIGILTTSDNERSEPAGSIVFVFLNAGLLHRPGPHRLHVRLARELAEQGITSLRVDMGGFGDSLAEPDLDYQQSVAADFREIVRLLESELGNVEIVLVGLCAGADSAVRLAPSEPRVTGMVLLDPVCGTDERFSVRARSWRRKAILRKALDPGAYGPWLKRKLASWLNKEQAVHNAMDVLSVRDLPSHEQTKAAISAVCEREGRVLSIFTSYAMGYYNEAGQLGRVLEVPGYGTFCRELFWPHALHTYPFESDRRQFIEEIEVWARHFVERRSSSAA